jgi:RNA polymerase sigma-70 factor (ECF subfamily)
LHLFQLVETGGHHDPKPNRAGCELVDPIKTCSESAANRTRQPPHVSTVGQSKERQRGAVPDDLRLARAAASGDPDAVATVVRRVGSNILAAVRNVVGWRDPDLDDIAQEATMALLRGLLDFRGEASLGRFAYRVALLTALTHRRSTRTRLRKEQDYATRVDEVSAALLRTPYVDALARQRRAVVLRLLGELSEPVAEALALHYLVGDSVESIATASGVSVNTVWSRLRLGKRALRRRLKRNAALLEAARPGPNV